MDEVAKTSKVSVAQAWRRLGNFAADHVANVAHKHRGTNGGAKIDDLKDLDHPAIVPIHHAGFKHFVVLRTIRDGRAYLADPSVGNISFTLAQFEEKWDDNVLFIVFPGGDKPLDNLELKEEDLRFVDDQTMTLLALDRIPEFHESTERRIQNLLERQKNNPDGSVQNTRKQLYYRRN